MRQSFSSVLPETGSAGQDRSPSRAPAVERIAGWSARHRKAAIFGWLLMVAVIFTAGQLMGSRNLPGFDPGQAGQAERALQRLAPDYFDSASETVLIQARAPGEAFSRSARMQQAARQVVAALSVRPQDARGIRSPLAPGGASLVSADGRSALVAFQVPGTRASADQRSAPTSRRSRPCRPAIPACSSRRPATRSIGRAIDDSLRLPPGRGDLGTDHADPAAGGVRCPGGGGHPGPARGLGGHGRASASSRSPVTGFRSGAPPPRWC